MHHDRTGSHPWPLAKGSLAVLLDEVLKPHQRTCACGHRPTSDMGGRPGQRAAGHSQLVADGDERHEEEGRERAEVLDGERLLVRVVEREILHGGRSVGR